MAPSLRGFLTACLVVLAVAPCADAAPPQIVTLAGGGQSTVFPGIDGAHAVTGTSVSLASAYGVIPDPNANGGVAFTDPLDNRILQLQPDGKMLLLAGNGSAGYIGDPNYPVRQDAVFRGPKSVGYYTPSFQLYYLISDSGNYCVLFLRWGVSPEYVHRHAGQCGSQPFAVVDGTGGTLVNPGDVEPYKDNSAYYVADGTLVRSVAAADGNITTIAGNGGSYPPANGTTASTAAVGNPTDIAATSTSGDYYIATDKYGGGDGRILHITGGKAYTVAGGGSGGLGDGAAATSAKLLSPSAVVLLADGGYLIYDGGNARIRRVSAGGTINTIAGSGTAGSSPDGTPADQAQIAGAGHLAVIDHGIVFTQGLTGAPGLVRLLPATSIVSGPDPVTQSTSAVFNLGSWDTSATFQCKLDTDPLGTCHSYSSLSEGTHTFLARATTDNGTRTDTLGATRTFIVDHSAPGTPVLTGPEEGSTIQTVTPTFTWTPVTDAFSGVARYDVYIDGALASSVKSCDASCSFTPGPLTEAAHTWQVRAVDTGGNEAPSATGRFTIASAPTAALTAAPARALAGRTVTLDASGSSDVGAGIVKYEFDTDGDGSYETDKGATASTVTTYSRPQTLTVGVRVTDGAGLTATATAPLTITVPPRTTGQLGVSINDGAQYTNDPNVTIFMVWPGFASDALISNDGGFKLAKDFPVADTVSWKLDSSGPERLPKTIYVRFTAGPQVSETYQDDIILDETPPKVVSADVAAPAPAATAAKAKKLVLRIKAKDNVSGVGTVQVTGNKRRPGRFLKYRKTLQVTPAKKLFVRARDRAGNLSAWRTAKRR